MEDAAEAIDYALRGSRGRTPGRTRRTSSRSCSAKSGRTTPSYTGRAQLAWSTSHADSSRRCYGAPRPNDDVTTSLAVTPARASRPTAGRVSRCPFSLALSASRAGVFGVDLGTPAGQTQGRFVSHPEGYMGVSTTDDLQSDLRRHPAVGYRHLRSPRQSRASAGCHALDVEPPEKYPQSDLSNSEYAKVRSRSRDPETALRSVPRPAVSTTILRSRNRTRSDVLESSSLRWSLRRAPRGPRTILPCSAIREDALDLSVRASSPICAGPWPRSTGPRGVIGRREHLRRAAGPRLVVRVVKGQCGCRVRVLVSGGRDSCCHPRGRVGRRLWFVGSAVWVSRAGRTSDTSIGYHHLLTHA